MGEDANGERGQESGAAIEGQGHPSHRGLWRARDERRALRAAGRAERFTRRFRLPTPGTVGDRRGPRAAEGTRGGGCAGGRRAPRGGVETARVAARGPPLQARPWAGEVGLVGRADGSFAWEAREFFRGFIGLRVGFEPSLKIG